MSLPPVLRRRALPLCSNHCNLTFILRTSKKAQGKGRILMVIEHFWKVLNAAVDTILRRIIQHHRAAGDRCDVAAGLPFPLQSCFGPSLGILGGNTKRPHPSSPSPKQPLTQVWWKSGLFTKTTELKSNKTTKATGLGVERSQNKCPTKSLQSWSDQRKDQQKTT